MAKHNVKCLVCGEIFDASIEEYGTEGRRYMHKLCAEKRAKEKMYIDDIHNYISHIYGTMYSKNIIDKQIKEMIVDGKEVEWIDKTLKYWYSIKKSDPSKSQGSIRIVNYVYNEAREYYNKKAQELNINKNVDVSELLKNETIEVKISPKPVEKPRRVKLFDLR